jgi:hypothetical protein
MIYLLTPESCALFSALFCRALGVIGGWWWLIFQTMLRPTAGLWRKESADRRTGVYIVLIGSHLRAFLLRPTHLSKVLRKSKIDFNLDLPQNKRCKRKVNNQHIANNNAPSHPPASHL